MSMYILPISLGLLSVIGIALVAVAAGIFVRLGRLIETISDLRTLAVGSQGELVQAKEGIGKMHGDISRLIANSNRSAEIIRSTTRLPTR